MESMLALVGILFFMFLVLSTAVEVILETFRGVLEWFGITWTKGKISVDDAISMAGEFTEGNPTLATKIHAVESVARQVEKKAGEKLLQLDKLGKDLADASKTAVEVGLKLNELASSIRDELDKAERKRVFILRFLTAVIGVLLIWKTEFYVFNILAQSPEAEKWLGSLIKVQDAWVNILVGGLATAAGSSYWHDKLDKVRKLKVVAKDIKQLRS